MRWIVVFVLVAVAGCSKSKDKDKETPTTPPSAAQADGAGGKPPEIPPAAPRDPRLIPIFDAGKQQACTWNDMGLANIGCDAEKPMRELAFEGQSDGALAASCVSALRDPDAIIRGLAAECFNQLNDATKSPHLAAALDAVEAEKEPTIRAAIARAAGNANAVDAKLEDRVIAAVRKLVVDPTGDAAAASLLGSLFRRYLAQSAQTSSKASGDLVLELAKAAPRWTRQRAIETAALMTDRAADACAALTAVAVAGEDSMWARAVHSIGTLGPPCASPALDPVIDVMVTAMQSNKYGSLEYDATKRLLDRVQLTPEQNRKLEAATKQLVAKAPSAFKDSAKDVAKRCIHNRDRKLELPK